MIRLTSEDSRQPWLDK